MWKYIQNSKNNRREGKFADLPEVSSMRPQEKEQWKHKKLSKIVQNSEDNYSNSLKEFEKELENKKNLIMFLEKYGETLKSKEKE